MNIPLSVVLLVSVAALGGAIALAGFAWAVHTGQLDQSNAGSKTIFDEEEPVGTPTDETFTAKMGRRTC